MASLQKCPVTKKQKIFLLIIHDQRLLLFLLFSSLSRCTEHTHLIVCLLSACLSRFGQRGKKQNKFPNVYLCVYIIFFLFFSFLPCMLFHDLWIFKRGGKHLPVVKFCRNMPVFCSPSGKRRKKKRLLNDQRLTKRIVQL